jgi:hypothetical protein
MPGLGNDLDKEKTSSSTTKIVGGDELYNADVFEDTEGIKRLQTSGKIDDGDVSISSALQIIESQTQINISPAAYSTIYSYAGAAVVSGFMIKFDTVRVKIRLTVDTNQIFDIDLEFLSGFTNWNNSSNPNTWISFNAGSNVVYFVPLFPLKAATNVTIDAISTQGNKKVEGYYIQVAPL